MSARSGAAPARTQTSPLRIKVDGADLPAPDMVQVLDVTVEQDLVLPDAFAIRIRDTNQRPGQDEQAIFAVLDGDRFPLGAEVEILAGRETAPAPIVRGEITSLEVDCRGDSAPVLTLRGYDRACRLHRERKSRTFLNVSDADLARGIAREHGLAGAVTDTEGVFEHIFQDHQTDWEFLRARAYRIGYELSVDGQRLVFRPPPQSGATPEVAFLSTLTRLRLRLSVPSQVQEVVVRGWDPRTKQEVIGSASRASQTAQIGETRSGSQLASPMGAGRFAVSDPRATTQAEALRLAQALFDEIAGELLQLEGTCLGNPSIRPGGHLRLSKVGQRFSGQYYVSGATHRITPDEGYLTRFVVSGRRPLTVTSLLNGGLSGLRGHPAGPAGPGGHSYAGVVVGIVTNNKPPGDVMQGQVKVTFPWLASDESAWARLAAPMAGPGRGFYCVPEINDEVLVAFEQGDINRPYVIGSLWNGRDTPPAPASQVVGPSGKVDQRIFKSRLGHVITIDDSADNPGISIVDKTEGNFIRLESRSNTLTVKVTGDLDLEARNTVTIKGRTVDVQALDELKLKGVTSSLEGTTTLNAKGATATVEATAAMTVKGATTSVQGTASTEVKGALVRIN